VKIIPAFMQILDKAGVNYGALGEEETCCGYLAYLVGDMQTLKPQWRSTTSKLQSKPKQLIPLVRVSQNLP
jgi:glycolate oxidase